MPRIGFALLLSVGSLAVVGEVYTWKDTNGRTHFGDRPPVLQAQPARAVGTILSASADHLELQSALSDEVRLFSRVAAAAGAGG